MDIFFRSVLKHDINSPDNLRVADFAVVVDTRNIAN